MASCCGVVLHGGRYWRLLDCRDPALDDHTDEFRQRVLRRVAERDDLDGVAREFGLSADLVFQWFKANADIGPAPGARRAAPVRALAPAGKPGARAGIDWGELAEIWGSAFLPLMLLFAVGHVRASRAAQFACAPVWIAIWLGLSAWHIRQSNRRLEGEGVDLVAAQRVGIAMLLALLSALSTGLLALALPAIPHALVSKPFEERTTILQKRIHHGKSTDYCFSTTSSTPGIQFEEWCTDPRTFDGASVGETMVVRGSMSWFGFKPDGFVLVPKR